MVARNDTNNKTVNAVFVIRHYTNVSNDLEYRIRIVVTILLTRKYFRELYYAKIKY